MTDESSFMDYCARFYLVPQKVKDVDAIFSRQNLLIVYSLDDIDKTYANDGVYLSKRRYTIVVIDKDPDTNLVQKVTNLPMSRFDRHFKKDNLNHYIFNVYF